MWYTTIIINCLSSSGYYLRVTAGKINVQDFAASTTVLGIRYFLVENKLKVILN
jgi:hypothetical protein